MTSKATREAGDALTRLLWTYLVGAVVFWVLATLLRPFTPAAASLAGLFAALLWAHIDVRWDREKAPTPPPRAIRLAETLFTVAVVIVAFSFPTGWSTSVAVSGVVFIATTVIGVLSLGRRHQRWEPTVTRFGRLSDAFGRVPARVRWGGTAAAALLDGYFAAAGIPFAGPVALLALLALTRPHWAAAKRDAQTRIAVERALAGVMTGGAWTPLLQTFGRIPVRRLDLDGEGTPSLLVLPLPEKAGKESQAKVSDEIEDRLSAWGDFAINWDTGAGRRLTIEHVEPLPDSLDYDGRPSTGSDGRKVWLGRGKVNREMVATQPDLAVGDTIDVFQDFALMPHALFIGGTGSGKSIAVQNVIAQWVRNHKVMVLDPKRVGFTRLRGKRNVLTVATDFEAMAEAIAGARDEMNARYTRLEREGLDNVMDLPESERPPLLLVVIDEATEAVSQERGIAKDDEDGQSANAAKAQIASAMSSIARLGRAAGVHLLVCTQRPDASDGLSGQTKAQLEARLLMGAADNTARLMAGFPDSNVQATPGVKGRGVFGRVNTAPIEVQVAFAPVTVFDDLPDADAPPPVDADGDGVVTVVEDFLAAESEAARVAVLRGAMEYGRLTDEDADACGYRDTADVARVIAEHDKRAAQWQREADQELALDRFTRRRETGDRSRRDRNGNTPPPSAAGDNETVAGGGGADERKRHNGRRVDPLPPGEARSRLEALVGLESTKAQIRLIEAKVRMEQRRAAANVGGGQVAPPNLIFIGPPGTGKTEVARIVGSLLRDLGVLPSGHLIDTTPASIKGAYVGHSGQMADTACDDALDGVLFIDEAYGLSRDEFGREALEQVMVRAENDRSRLCVILAGYPAEMDDLLEVNPGIRSRFPNRVEFGNYTLDELVAIGEVTTESLGFRWGTGTDKAFRELVSRQDQASREWANARTVRNLVQGAVDRLDLRLGALADDQVSPLDLVTLLPVDVLPVQADTTAPAGEAPGRVEQVAEPGLEPVSPEDWLNQFTA